MTGSWLFCQEKVLDAGYASKQLLRFLLKQVNEKAESSAKVWVSKAGVLKGGSQTEWIICFKLLNNLWFRREFFLIVCVIHSKFHFYRIYHCKIRKKLLIELSFTYLLYGREEKIELHGTFGYVILYNVTNEIRQTMHSHLNRLSWHEIVGTFCKDHSMEFAESNISNISSIFRGIILNLLTGLLLTRQIIL